MLKARAYYLAAFIVLMSVLALVTSWWQQVDWWLFARLNRDDVAVMSNDVVLVDVAYHQDVEIYRERVCRVLDALADRLEQRPKAIALDVKIENNPRGLDLLKACIGRIQARGVNVYAAIDPLDKNREYVEAGFIGRHAQELYRDLLDGYGHTVFEYQYGVAKYDPYLDLGDGRELPALPIKIAEQEYARSVVRANSPIVLWIGNAQEVARRTVEAGLKSAGKVAIVGSLAEDKGVSDLDFRPGPELLAWALSERIVPADSALPRILSDWRLLLAVVAVLSLLPVFCFAGLRALPLLREARAWMLAIVSGGVSVVGLALFVWALRRLSYIYPQVTLALAAITLSAGLIWLKAWRKSERDVFAIDLEGRERRAAGEYDVFISYSRTPENARWVESNVYEPLLLLHIADNSPLRIFFDRESIKIGTQWYGEIARAIENSKVFVPVYSEDYFEKDFCRFEMDKAAIKAVRQKGFVLPIARVTTGIPGEYSHIQFLDVATRSDFVRELQEAVRAALAANAEKSRAT